MTEIQLPTTNDLWIAAKLLAIHKLDQKRAKFLADPITQGYTIEALEDAVEQFDRPIRGHLISIRHQATAMKCVNSLSYANQRLALMGEPKCPATPSMFTTRKKSKLTKAAGLGR